MSDRPKCETCRWWAPDVYPIAADCRRNSPVYVDTGDGNRRRWPVTKERDWCGEHAPKEAGDE